MASTTETTALEIIINGKRVPVASLREARRAWNAYREQAMYDGLSGADLMGRHDGKVFQGKTKVARMSFNGRIWDNNDVEITNF